MASQIDSAVLQRTRETLGKVIKKPPLTDKLLSRPPFRFLHDILCEVRSTTCWAKKKLFLIIAHHSVSCVYTQSTSAFPPFLTYAHMQVNKNTGFYNGLYTAQELDAKSIQVHYSSCMCAHSDTRPAWPCSYIVYL